MTRAHYTSILLPVLIFVGSCNKRAQTDAVIEKDALLESGYWRSQALEDILQYWTRYARDPAGGFYSTLDENWQPVADSIKFPSMIARHLFSYSAAYLLSGKDEYFDVAAETKDYLLSNAWDKTHGGWFDALDRNGKVMHAGKSTFVQVYVITGLTMYYFVTHDKEVLDYINRSNDLLEQKVWDPHRGGYYDDIAQDWSLNSDRKSFASQLAPVSGYLLYLYLATADEKYLRQAERICDTVLDHMVDGKTGWVLESFNAEWKYQPANNDEEEINVGHNIETAWSLARLYRLNKKDNYLRVAESLADSLHRYGFNSESGFWFGTIGNTNPSLHSEFTYWWIQAYGIMFDAYLAALDDTDRYADHFLEGARYWDQKFLDTEQGDTHFSVFQNGLVKDHLKANQYKASYHNVEHALLNFLYLAEWVNPTPYTLYFRIRSSEEGERLYPLPIEESSPVIKRVLINGEEYTFGQSEGKNFVTLPAISDGRIEVAID